MSAALLTNSDHEWGDAVRDALEGAGLEVVALSSADLTPRERVGTVVASAASAVEALAALVTLPPPLPTGPALELGLAAFADAIDAGVNAMFSSCREAARLAVERGTRLTVVNLVSVLGAVALPGSLATSCTSAAVVAAGRALAAEWGPLGIRVVAAAIGPTTSWIESDIQQIPGLLPLQRAVAPEDVGDAVRFLLDSGAVAGPALLVDGGWLSYGWRRGGG